MSRAERSFVTRCSLAVRPVDIWTGNPPSGSAIQVSLEESHRKPIRTSDGSYAFLDVAGKSCTLVISSSTYMEFRQEIHFVEEQAQPPVILVSLLPNSIYSPPAAATALSFIVIDSAGSPIAGAVVSAYVEDEEAIRGRLAEEKSSGEGNLIRISPGKGKLLPGDSFVLKEREGLDVEWGKVVELKGDYSLLVLERPFSRIWSRGSRLLPAVQTRSDHKGRVVLPFRGHLPSQCSVTMRVEVDERRNSTTWTVDSGRVNHYPPIQL